LYHQRWRIESGVSQYKRRLGSALTARKHQAQRRELILRVLTHKRMFLVATVCAFQQKKRPAKRKHLLLSKPAHRRSIAKITAE
jgi:hypothetical protein